MGVFFQFRTPSRHMCIYLPFWYFSLHCFFFLLLCFMSTHTKYILASRFCRRYFWLCCTLFELMSASFCNGIQEPLPCSSTSLVPYSLLSLSFSKSDGAIWYAEWNSTPITAMICSLALYEVLVYCADDHAVFNCKSAWQVTVLNFISAWCTIVLTADG